MNTVMQKNSEILNRTADVVEEYGWGKGGRSMLGEDGICVEGAMHLVLTGRLPVPTEAAFLQIIMDDGPHIITAGGAASGEAYGVVETSPAGRALKHYLDLYGEPLWSWNDYKIADQQEIVEALRACALIEAAKEDGTYVEPEPATIAEAYGNLGYTQVSWSIPVVACPVGGIKMVSDFESIKVKYDSAVSGDEVFQTVPALSLAVANA